MAKFRMIHTEFWNDPKVVEEMTPEDKFFFLYLLTNSNTTQVGIYQITKKQIAFDIGYSIESINSLLDRFVKQHKLVRYNPETREIAIKNWGKYNFNRGGKPVLDCVTSELKTVKDKSLIQFVGERIEKKDIKNIYETYYDTGDETHHDSYNDSTKTEKPNNDKCLRDTYHDTPTISRQEEEKEEEKEEENEEEQQQEKGAVPEIVQFWDENGFGLNNIQGKKQLLSWLDDSPFSVPKQMILKAMNIACSNNARRLNYVEGILRNWENESLLTTEEVDQRDSKKSTTKQESRYGNSW